jgi:capsular exopolysaccharide synthesis family protein
VKFTSSPVQVIIKLLIKWWWLVAVSVAIGAGVGYFIRSQQADIYYARATVLFDQELAQGGQINDLTGIQEVMAVNSGLIRREKMLQPVIDKLNLNLTVDELNLKLAIQTVPNLPLLEILIGDTSAVVAANIANAIAQEVINQSPTEQLNDEQAFKRAQLRDLQTQIETSQNQYNDLIASGASLTSAFDIVQNTQQQSSTLATIRELQALYADMSAGIDDKSGLLSIFEPASAETAIPVTGSSTSVILSAAAGLILSVGTVVLISYLDDRLEYNEGVERIEGVPVLGPLGLIPKNKLPLYTETMPDAIESEVLRQVRAKLVLSAGGTPPKVVTITSYDSGDGKTVTAANLALISAQSGLRTILVDGDIRKGDAHELFHLPNVMGLSDILAGRENIEVLLSRSLLDSGYENLTILTSGRSTADPGALVSSPRFASLISILRTQFDVVIMDSVPTIGGSDSAFMAEVSDGVLIVVHAQRTTNKALNRVLRTLRQAGKINIYGIVFNRISLQITPSHNQPYYRRTLAISPEKLNQELQKADKKGGAFGFRRNVVKDPSGELLYSVPAAAVQLGVTEPNIKHWVNAGYLKAERKGRRMWIRQSEIDRLLEQIPRSALYTKNEIKAISSPAGDLNGQNTAMSDLLRVQRDALLEFAREPAKPEETDDTESP